LKFLSAVRHSQILEEVAMVSMASLWLPILLSAVFAFIVSSVVHMLLTYHRSDLVKLPGEDGIGEALRQADVPPGDYMIPQDRLRRERH
jgi:hypothetical protein